MDFTHRLTVDSSLFRPAARPSLSADSLTVSGPPAPSLPPSCPPSKTNCLHPLIHRHAHNAHLPPPESSHCSAELVKGLVRFSKKTMIQPFHLIAMAAQLHKPERSQPCQANQKCINRSLTIYLLLFLTCFIKCQSQLAGLWATPQQENCRLMRRHAVHKGILSKIHLTNVFQK